MFKDALGTSAVLGLLAARSAPRILQSQAVPSAAEENPDPAFFELLLSHSDSQFDSGIWKVLSNF